VVAQENFRGHFQPRGILGIWRGECHIESLEYKLLLFWIFLGVLKKKMRILPRLICMSEARRKVFGTFLKALASFTFGAPRSMVSSTD
jgi:hypothetical protein